MRLNNGFLIYGYNGEKSPRLDSSVGLELVTVNHKVSGSNPLLDVRLFIPCYSYK